MIFQARSYFQIMFILVLCSVFWSLSNGAAIVNGAWTLPPPRDRIDDLLKRLNITMPNIFDDFTDKPFVWDRFTRKPFVWDRPSLRDRIDDMLKRLNITMPNIFDDFTDKPFVWNRFTRDPFVWNKLTLKPDIWPTSSYRYVRSTDDTALKLAVFFPALFIGILLLICRYYVCGKESSTESSAPTIHPHPRRNIPPASQSRSFYSGAPNTRPSALPPNRNTYLTVCFSPNENNVTDKPPDYASVVLGDFASGETKFQEVNPTIPETPPPMYDEQDKVRY